MSLVGLLIFLLIAAVMLWIISLIPMDATAKRVFMIVAAVIILLWLLQAAGFLAHLH